MPKEKKKQSSYSQEDVEKALKSIGEGMTYRKAAEKYHIPRTTLYSKIQNIYPMNAKKGPASILSTSEEQKIIDWIDYCAERGFPITKTQLLDTVQKFVTELGIENPFKDNRPGRH